MAQRRAPPNTAAAEAGVVDAAATAAGATLDGLAVEESCSELEACPKRTVVAAWVSPAVALEAPRQLLLRPSDWAANFAEADIEVSSLAAQSQAHLEARASAAAGSTSKTTRSA